MRLRHICVRCALDDGREMAACKSESSEHLTPEKRLLSQIHFEHLQKQQQDDSNNVNELRVLSMVTNHEGEVQRIESALSFQEESRDEGSKDKTCNVYKLRTRFDQIKFLITRPTRRLVLIHAIWEDINKVHQRRRHPDSDCPQSRRQILPGVYSQAHILTFDRNHTSLGVGPSLQDRFGLLLPLARVPLYPHNPQDLSYLPLYPPARSLSPPASKNLRATLLQSPFSTPSLRPELLMTIEDDDAKVVSHKAFHEGQLGSRGSRVAGVRTRGKTGKKGRMRNASPTCIYPGS
ncbi:hypothetical protein EV360DRAFT_72932 [Lentinula raphanica]|nr:hypothetical protein EV360DRAFT_72932 [Lentinula raphanica]